MGATRPERHWLGKFLVTAFLSALNLGLAGLLNQNLELAAFLWGLVGLLTLLSLQLAGPHLPQPLFERASVAGQPGWTFHWKPPDIPSRKRLYRTTMGISSDLRKFAHDHPHYTPDEFIERHNTTSRALSHPEGSAERKQIFDDLARREMQRAQDNQHAYEPLVGKVRFVIHEYERRGLIPDGGPKGAPNLTFKGNYATSADDMATELEALALRLGIKP
jgi:hypothetical protein